MHEQSGSTDLLTRSEAAAILGLRPQTLATWAATGRYGLKYIRTGRRAMYSRAQIEAWIKSRTITRAGELVQDGDN